MHRVKGAFIPLSTPLSASPTPQCSLLVIVWFISYPSRCSPPHRQDHLHIPLSSAQWGAHSFDTGWEPSIKTLKCKQRSTGTRAKRFHSELWAGIFGTSNCKCRVKKNQGLKRKARALIWEEIWNLDLVGERILLRDPNNLKMQRSSALCRQHCFHNYRLAFSHLCGWRF